MRRAAALVAVLALLGAACTASTPTANPSSPAPSVSPSPTGSPSATPTPKPPAAKVATYVANDRIWIYDVATDTVRDVARGKGVRDPRFISETEVSFIQSSGIEQAATLRIVDLEDRVVREVFSISTGIQAYGWSPDRRTVAYVTTDSRGYPRIEFRDVEDGGAVRPVATLAAAPGRGGSPDDQTKVQFSPDGQLVLIVYTPADGSGDDPIPSDQAQLQVRTIDGTLAHAPSQSSEPTMGLWSPDGTRAYYRTAKGGRFWSPQTGKVTVLTGRPQWFEPAVSVDGAMIAYDTGQHRDKVRIRVYDVAKKKSSTLGPTYRATPVFAGPRTVWAQKMRKCADACFYETERVSEVFAIDLKTGKETKIALTQTSDLDVFYA